MSNVPQKNDNLAGEVTEADSINTMIDTLREMFKGKEFTLDQRSRIAGFVRHELEVPGTIWSPEDFDDYMPEDLTEDEKDEARAGAYESLYHNSDLDESDWEGIRYALNAEVTEVMMNRQMLLDTVYVFSKWDKTITSDEDENELWRSAVIHSEVKLDEVPTGHELSDILKDIEEYMLQLILSEDDDGLKVTLYKR